jgi:Trk-type K+ transport system membrane component
MDESIVPWINYHNKPAEWRLQIVSAITGTAKNTTALDIVNHIYDYIRKGTNNDTRIKYQTISYEFEDGQVSQFIILIMTFLVLIFLLSMSSRLRSWIE